MMLASTVLVDPRIKPDTIVTVLGHVVQWTLWVPWVLHLPVLIVGGLFGGPRIWQCINVLNQKTTKQKTMVIYQLRLLWGRGTSPFGGLLSRSRSRVCACVCVCAWVCVCLCVCVCVCVCTCACTSVYLCTLCMCMYVPLCMSLCMHASLCVHHCVCTCSCVCMCLYVAMCVYMVICDCV